MTDIATSRVRGSYIPNQPFKDVFRRNLDVLKALDETWRSQHQTYIGGEDGWTFILRNQLVARKTGGGE